MICTFLCCNKVHVDIWWLASNVYQYSSISFPSCISSSIPQRRHCLIFTNHFLCLSILVISLLVFIQTGMIFQCICKKLNQCWNCTIQTYSHCHNGAKSKDQRSCLISKSSTDVVKHRAWMALFFLENPSVIHFVPLRLFPCNSYS